MFLNRRHNNIKNKLKKLSLFCRRFYWKWMKTYIFFHGWCDMHIKFEHNWMQRLDSIMLTHMHTVESTESNWINKRPVTIDGMSSVGIFLRDPSPYLREFRRKPLKIQNGYAISVTKNWARHLKSTCFERRTARPFGGATYT